MSHEIDSGDAEGDESLRLEQEFWDLSGDTYDSLRETVELLLDDVDDETLAHVIERIKRLL